MSAPYKPSIGLKYADLTAFILFSSSLPSSVNRSLIEEGPANPAVLAFIEHQADKTADFIQLHGATPEEALVVRGLFREFAFAEAEARRRRSLN